MAAKLFCRCGFPTVRSTTKKALIRQGGQPAALLNLPFLPHDILHIMKLGVTEYVDCAHFLPGHPKCGPLHGHTYKVEVVVEGKPKDGMIIDFADLKHELREVLRQYDHRSWNDF